MIEQFQKILSTPKPSSEGYLQKIQDSMLNTLETMLPLDFDFSELAVIFEAEKSQPENLLALTYRLSEYFMKVISENFISSQTYFALEDQTQKLQSTIRGHIKIEQEMKMYLEHLEFKIERYEFHLKKLRQKSQLNNNFANMEGSSDSASIKENYELVKKRETQLLKERLVLLKKLEHLERKLKDQEVELKRLNSPSSATIQQIKLSIARKGNEIQPEHEPKEIEAPQLSDKNVPERVERYSLSSDNQITQKKTSNPGSILRLNSQGDKDRTDKNSEPHSHRESTGQIP